ncbi:MAG: XisI protein [Anaerolineae bacterium]|jgi:hypothetical protein|nr:XisI protein [Anaerolineae bacterium]
MERVISLAEALKQELTWYANTIGYKTTTYFFCDDEHQKYIIVDATNPDFPGDYSVAIMMMAHIENGYIVVDADNTDKPLYEGLMHAGIPREKIILAYAGERVPSPQS